MVYRKRSPLQRPWRLLAPLLSIGAIFSSGCSPREAGLHDSLVHRLSDRGPVVLSSDNPYLAGNLWLSKEMALRPELKGFVDHRGAPHAIEVEQPMFSALLVHFYYPESRQEYELEDSEGTWIIRGPQPMAREKIGEVTLLRRADSAGVALAPAGGADGTARTKAEILPDAATSEESGRRTRESSAETQDDPFLKRLEEANRREQRSSARDSQAKAGGFRSPASPEEKIPAFLKEIEEPPRRAESERRLSEPLPPRGGLSELPGQRKGASEPIKPRIPSPAKEARDSAGETAHSSSSSDLGRPEPKATSTSTSSEQTRSELSPQAHSETDSEADFLRKLAERLNQQAAEITPKGDLVHYVTLQGETLSVIARWYTFDRNNAPKLARINQLKEPNQLSLGDVIVIPSYLIKNKARLSDDALHTIQNWQREH